MKKNRIALTHSMRERLNEDAFLAAGQLRPFYAHHELPPAVELEARPAHLEWFIRKAVIAIAEHDGQSTLEEIRAALAMHRKSSDGTTYLFTRLEWI